MIRTAIAIFLLLIAVSARAETPGECIVLGGQTLRHDSWGPLAPHAARPPVCSIRYGAPSALQGQDPGIALRRFSTDGGRETYAIGSGD